MNDKQNGKPIYCFGDGDVGDNIMLVTNYPEIAQKVIEGANITCLNMHVILR